jgi:hypothetical protein
VTREEIASVLWEPNDVTHPAFPAFVVEMDKRQYGEEETNDAWGWFVSGWQAARAR